MGEIDLGTAAEATVHAYKELAADPSKRLPLALVRNNRKIFCLIYFILDFSGSNLHTIFSLCHSRGCRNFGTECY